MLTTGRHMARQPRATVPDDWSPALLDRLTLLCTCLWRLLSSTPTCQSQPSKYSFMYHCLVVLYQCAEPRGFTCPAFAIAHEPVLAAGLPQIADLRLPPLCLDFTPAYNIFLTAAATLPPT